VEPGGGPFPFQQSVTNALGPFEAATKAIENAQFALTTSQGMSNAELLASLATARAAIQDVAQRQQRLTDRFNALAALGIKIENEKASLQRDKSELETRERVYSLTLLATIGGLIVAGVALIQRISMDRLDKQLKRLEIKEKEIALRESETKLP